MASKEPQRVNLYWETVLLSILNPKPENLVTNAQWDLLTGNRAESAISARLASR